MNPMTLEISDVGYDEDVDNYLYLDSDSSDVEGYVKPEEVGRAMVSESFDFVLFPSQEPRWASASRYWFNLLNSIRHLLAPACLNPLKTTGTEGLKEQQMKLVVISAAPLSSYFGEEDQTDRDGDDDDDWIEPEPVEVPVKVKLIGNHFLEDQQSAKESSCIVKLAKCLQPATLQVLEVVATGDCDVYYGPIPFEISELVWKPEELAWETETTLVLNEKNLIKDNCDNFRFYVDRLRIGFQLTDQVIASAIQHEFGVNRPNSLAGQRQLENEINTNLTIIDQNGESVKCHQFPLMNASSRLLDMLDRSKGWKEGQTQTVTLDMSKDAIVALLHFIYYGGSERILTGSVNMAMELLQFGHLYEIQKVVDATTAILMIRPDEQFTVAEAWHLFHFARSIPEDCQGWRDLQERCCNFLFDKADRLTVQTTEEYQNLIRISKEIGPALVPILEETEPETFDDTKALPVNFAETSQEDCCLLLDCLKFSSENFGRIVSKYGNYSDYALSLLLLAEHCKSEIPAFSKENWDGLLAKPVNWFEVDYLVALFTLACGMKTENFKAEFKLKIAEKLKWFKLNKPNHIQESEKYKEMMQNNWKTGMELDKLFAQLACKNENREELQDDAD